MQKFFQIQLPLNEIDIYQYVSCLYYIYMYIYIEEMHVASMCFRCFPHFVLKVLATDCIHCVAIYLPEGPLEAFARLGSLWREMEK